MDNNKKLLTQASIIAEFRGGNVSLPPLQFRLIESELVMKVRYRLDAFIEGHWNNSTAIFAAEIKALSTPKAFREGVALLKTTPLPEDKIPLLITPYLSEEQLKELESEGISGIDLCGNGVVIIPDKLTVFRTGQKNLFPSYLPIKNIYRKSSSMVARTFLVHPQFSSIKEIVKEIRQRDLVTLITDKPSLTFSTVSKVLAGMEQDLIIERSEGIIRLLQLDVLFEKLTTNYIEPVDTSKISAKVKLEGKALFQHLGSLSVQLKIPIVATGISSVSRYSIMEREEKLSIYCPRGDDLLSHLNPDLSNRFPNIEIIVTENAPVYFDARNDNSFFWASPVQTYLELMKGDKRDQETADQVKTFILKNIN